MTDPTRPMPPGKGATRPLPSPAGGTTRPLPPPSSGSGSLPSWLWPGTSGEVSDPGLAELERALGGRYRIEGQIGAGGMGRVFKAVDLELERTVALKTIQPQGLAEPEWLARFRLEAVLAAGLQHPGIVQVHEVQESDGIPVLIMEYVEGQTLEEYLDTKRPPDRELARIHTFTHKCSTDAKSITYDHALLLPS